MPPSNLLQQLPSPRAIQQRLGELYREERLLQRLMKLSLLVRDEQQQRTEQPQEQQHQNRNVSGNEV